MCLTSNYLIPEVKNSHSKEQYSISHNSYDIIVLIPPIAQQLFMSYQQVLNLELFYV